jgi:methionyl-tRNA formyltransferase
MDRLKIGFFYYREWSIKLVDDVVRMLEPTKDNIIREILRFNDKNDLSNIKPEEFNIIFFIGWSSIVPSRVFNNTNCVVLHPSALPKYRGGSPIQNQIINGVTNSMVSFIKMNEGIDEGNIIYQVPLSLSGNLDDIFTNIIELSAPIILAIILQYFYLERFVTQKQNDENASYYPRRTADMSEIKINDFNLFSALELHNKIRSLQDPYPNAYIKCKDNSFLYIIESKISG